MQLNKVNLQEAVADNQLPASTLNIIPWKSLMPWTLFKHTFSASAFIFLVSRPCQSGPLNIVIGPKAPQGGRILV